MAGIYSRYADFSGGYSPPPRPAPTDTAKRIPFLPDWLDMSDVILLLLLFFLYLESGDEDFLIILVVVGFSVFDH